MGLMNGLFLTLISAIACLSLPKLLSLVLVRQTQRTASLPIVTTSEKTY
ncbi:MAG: hypothetical protein KME22_20375 [Hassallia sp. WJT32-NPBG1]|jgi:hypothetical protein|nr:hypothetical protein [Spirirestis rafaelensis WJT71-NPBG6]MBW4609492.1 hypothetical protein [Hassallia sp. WJT32-NPBG1]